ncbi:MAG: hypothetical protein ACNA7K_06185 [Acholeplasmataceae bacterium]
MKQIMTVCLLIFLSIALMACDNTSTDPSPHETPIETQAPVLHLDAQTLVGRWVFNHQYLTYKTYDDFLEFMTFYQSKNSVPAYALDAFLEHYTASFFETNDLLIMMFPEHVAISIELSEMTIREDTLSIHVNHMFPDVYPNGDTHIVYYSAIAIDKSLNVIEHIDIKHHMKPITNEHYNVYLFQQYGYDEDDVIDFYFNLYDIQTYEGLTTFYQTIDHLFPTPEDFCNLGQILSCLAYGHPRLDVLIASYDQTYFEDHMLLFIPMMESSGSIRHQLDDISIRDGELLVRINRIIPQMGTTDMKGWMMVIEYPKPETPYHTYTVTFESMLPTS